MGITKSKKLYKKICMILNTINNVPSNKMVIF